MRKSKQRVTKAVLSFLICICLVFPFTESLYAYTNGNGMGTMVFNERREIAQGVFLDTWVGKTPSGTPKRGYTISFNPKTSDAQALTFFGNTVGGRATLSRMIAEAEAQGYTVIGGINGDFYNLSNGVPIGLMIKDGRLISNNASKWGAIGFKKDGSVVIGFPSLEIKAVLSDGQEFAIANFNKAQGDWGPYMYTSDFGQTTGSSVPSLEVVVDISTGTPALGNMLIGTVSAVNANAMATPIGKDQVVLSARHGKNGEYALSQLNVGDAIAFSFRDPEDQWTDVQQAIGGEKILLKDGQIPDGIPTSDVNPYTAIGVKANGEVVLLQVDGRKNGHSFGISSMDAAKFLQDQGCINAISLDGGGSSTIAARMPGDTSPKVLNSPSDGSERANSNALLLVSKQAIRIGNGEASPSQQLKRLHIYPGKTFMLPGSTLNLSVKGTDEYFFPAAIPGEVEWQAKGGKIQNGEYTAPDTPGTYQITARYGDAVGSATIVVLSPSQITGIRPSAYSFNILPGTSQKITLMAQLDTVPVAANSRLAQWKVEGNVGSITKDGVFTAASNAEGQGTIQVTLGKQTASITVYIAQPPVVLEGFENGTAWGTTGVRVASHRARIVEDPDLAAFGSKVLRLDYDMTLAAGVEKGTAGVYAYPLGPDGTSATIVLDKTPTAIGMWVYGDNSKNWLRARLRDGKGETFDINLTSEYRPDTGTGGIDWTGWKYVEAAIPAGREGPFTLELPVRLMCSRDDMRTKGTIYIDQIRAIYGAKSDDLVPPSGTIQAPADQAVFQAGKVEFKAQITDNNAIDKNSIQLFLDNGRVNDVKITEIPQGYQVEAQLGANVPLADGLHVAKLRFTDKFGNNGSKAVTFRVSTGAPEAVATVGESDTVVGAYDYTVSIKNPNTLKKLYLSFAYDKDSVEIVDADTKTPGIQAELEDWMKNGKVVHNVVDTENGRIIIEVENLNAATREPELKAVTIRMRPKEYTAADPDLTLVLGAMIVGQNKGGSTFSLSPAVQQQDYDLILKVDGFSRGSMTEIRVTDKEGNPVENARIYYNGMMEFHILTTDKNGLARSDVFTDMAPGSVVSLQAVKDGLLSNIYRFTVSEPASGLEIQKLSIAFDDSPSALKFHYLTPPDQTGTVIQIVEKSKFTGTFQNASAFNGQDSEGYILDGGRLVTVRSHTVSVKGLKPGVAYVYRFRDSVGRASETYELVWPNTGKTYSFLFLTDPQAYNAAGYSLFGNVLQRAYAVAENPAFVILGGDMVDRGGNKSQWDMFFGYSFNVLSRLPMMAVPGNHETYDDTDLINYRAYLALPENGPSGYAETAYSFETDDALFMVLNTQASIQPQLEWMQKKAASSNKKWKIVVMHRGLYAGFYNESELRNAIAPVMDKLGIDLVLNGHDHLYLRTTMKNGVKTTPGKGTTYITGGSSASKYYDAENRPWTQVLFDDNKPVFTVLKVQKDKISVTSYHVDNGKNVVHDRFDITK
ncbi:phosphodiester glycosidase family protein [Thermoclostridium caenicola]|uniref:Calcineurin-like phosphoesterase n=1 Tax=Thermoclostridium caenicola TaxID=659425 RepID=A0A1M6C052_9FIRM|nr:phosphodiester glycosidase family protein [Thermoclostridium caenicola]SHI54449.1 Calcineurin-like phosphoesterase [Thermoclostridium caenicola]